MVFRLRTAICGAVMTLAFSSVAMARSEIDAVHSNAIVASRTAIIGAASMYNPYQPGYREGGVDTASGERYDSSAWAAAIKTNLRNEFGGVRYGATPKYALVEGAGKKAIVKINDVGPLRPGRIIDFNERTMRYFDPSLQRGVIDGVKVTPLSGDDWTPGPVGTDSRQYAIERQDSDAPAPYPEGLENPLGALPIRSNVDAALTACRADELVLDIGNPRLIRPAIGVVRDDVEMTAAMIRAVDKNIAHASGAHLGVGDLLLAHQPNESLTRLIAGCVRLFTLAQCFDRSA